MQDINLFVCGSGCIEISPVVGAQLRGDSNFWGRCHNPLLYGAVLWGIDAICGGNMNSNMIICKDRRQRIASRLDIFWIVCEYLAKSVVTPCRLISYLIDCKVVCNRFRIKIIEVSSDENFCCRIFLQVFRNIWYDMFYGLLFWFHW